MEARRVELDEPRVATATAATSSRFLRFLRFLLRLLSLLLTLRWLLHLPERHVAHPQCL